MMSIAFITKAKGLTIEFQNLSGETGDAIPVWDFGDGTTITNVVNPVHTYSAIGRYSVTLKYVSDSTVIGSDTQVVMVSDVVKTTLSDTIYLLINNYLPVDIFGEISISKKSVLIEKWQLYLAPLVNHKIPDDEIYNELYYEALENQLVMELAAYDYMVLNLNQMVQAVSNNISSSEISSAHQESEGDGDGKVKHITTGPTEVEFFDNTDLITDTLSAIIKAMNPDGVIALMKQQVCMLAERLDIYLPICPRLPVNRVVPKVVNRRRPGFLGGPDPIETLNK